jgi:MFS family permease
MRPDPPRPGTAGPPRRVILQVGAAQTALGFAVAGIGGSLLLLARDLRVEYAALAWIASAFGVGLLVVGAAFRLLLRRGPQPLLRAAALTAALGALLVATAPGVAAAAAGGLLLGLGNAALALLTPTLLHGPDSGRLLATATGISCVAGVLAPPTLAAVDALGPSGRLGFALVAVPLLGLAASARAAARVADEPPPATDPPARPRHVLRRWAAVVLAVAVEFCFVVWGVARLQTAGLTPAAATAVSTAFVTGMAVARIGAARLAAHPAVVLHCALLLAAATVLVAAADGPVPVAVGLGVAGAATALLYPATLSRLLAAATPERGAAIGAVASGTAILLAPTGLGLLAGVLDLRLAFPAAVLPLAAALVVADLLPAPRERP